VSAPTIGHVYDVYVQEHDSQHVIVWRRCTFDGASGDALRFWHPADVYEELDLDWFVVEKWNVAKLVEVEP